MILTYLKKNKKEDGKEEEAKKAERIPVFHSVGIVIVVVYIGGGVIEYYIRNVITISYT